MGSLVSLNCGTENKALYVVIGVRLFLPPTGLPKVVLFQVGFKFIKPCTSIFGDGFNRALSSCLFQAVSLLFVGSRFFRIGDAGGRRFTLWLESFRS